MTCYLALVYTAPFCCDTPAHPEAASFKLQEFLPGPIFTESMVTEELATKAATITRSTRHAYRSKAERPALDFRLIKWLENEHACDPLRDVRPPYHILSHTQREKLIRVHRNSIKASSDITELLDESKEWETEWANKIYQIIDSYNTELDAQKGTSHQTKRKRA